MKNSKTIQAVYALSITIFFIFFLFQSLYYLETSKEFIAIICSIFSAMGIIVSIFYTKNIMSIALMVISIFLALYVAFLYWNLFHESYKFFVALGLLGILVYSLIKVSKK